MVRAPVRPPGPPSSTIRLTGCSFGVDARTRSISSTVCTLSAQPKNSNDGSASNSAASHASAAGSTMAFASMIRPTPKDRASCTCHGVASVIPHAPASSCRAHTCGAIVVLPCGASRTPADRAQSAITATFDSSAARSTVSSGVDIASRVGRVRRKSRTVLPHAWRGRPLCCGPSTRSSRAATAPLSITCVLLALRILQQTLRIMFVAASLQQT